MAQNQNDETMAGNVVGGAAGAVETVARQVEGAAVEATEFASDQVLGRIIGYVRAAKNIGTGGLQGGLDVVSGGGDILLRELEELKELVEAEVKKAAGENK